MKNKYKTIYELASELSSDVQNEGLPQFTAWLFSDYYNLFEGDLQQAIALEFIQAFIRRYLNREIFHTKKEVFRSALYYELNKYFDYLSTVQDEYKGLIQADVTLTGSTNTKRDLSDMTTLDNKTDRTGSVIDKVTNEATSEQTTKNTKDVDTTTTNTGTQKMEGTSERTDDLTSNTTGAETGTVGVADRNIVSDYPQSNVSQGVDPVFNYTYASGANDNHRTETRDLGNNSTTKNTGTQTNTVDNTRTDNLQGTTTGTETDNGTNNLTSNQTVDKTQNTSDNSTSVGHNDKTVEESIEVTRSDATISAFDKLLRILDYLDKNPYSPVYTVVEKMQKYFISTYVDEERDGWLDPSTDIIKYIIGGA
ncbi:MAG: hypothetical protein HDR03_14985 [Lachnospiraceae bacterium]|nr:hypothetical protein [Lachnospiraceae bacterium]